MKLISVKGKGNIVSPEKLKNSFDIDGNIVLKVGYNDSQEITYEIMTDKSFEISHIETAHMLLKTKEFILVEQEEEEQEQEEEKEEEQDQEQEEPKKKIAKKKIAKKKIEKKIKGEK